MNNIDINLKDNKNINKEYRTSHKKMNEEELKINQKFFTIQSKIISTEHKDNKQ